MSLFDDDDLSSTASSCGKEIVEADCNGSGKHTAAECLSTIGSVDRANAVGVPGVRVKGVSQFTLTVDEKKRAEERWRTEIAGSSLLRAAATGGGQCGANSSLPWQSRFSASIAEALKLRKESAEALRLRRIQRQREEDANDEELVKKDRDVGVFVTPEYMEALKRQKDPYLSSDKELPGGVTSNHSNKNDDDDPLETYLQQLEERRSTTGLYSYAPTGSSGLGDSTDKVEGMSSMPGKQGESSVSSTKDSITAEMNYDLMFNEPTSLPSIPTPSTGITVGGALSPQGGRRGDGVCPNNVGQSSVVTSECKNEMHSEDALREAREMRKRRRADCSFIQDATERFITRAMERLDSH